MDKLFDIIEGKSFDDVKNILQKSYGFKVKEDKNYPDLYLLVSQSNLTKQYDFVQRCHGLILEKGSNRVVCNTFGLIPELSFIEKNVNLEHYNISLKNSTINNIVEGTHLRLFYYDNRWMVSTMKCIDASRAYWNSKKSFYDLYQETIAKMNWSEDKLDKTMCYSVILQHPANRIIYSVTNPKLYYFSNFNFSDTQTIDIGLPNMDCIENPSNNFRQENNYYELIKYLQSFKEKYITGFIVKDNTTGYMVRIVSPLYLRMKELRGNIFDNNHLYRYITLRCDKNVKEYLNYFPEDCEKFTDIENKLRGLVTEIHKEYCEKFVNKTKKMKDIFYAFRPFIYEIQGYFLNDRNTMTKYRVLQELLKWHPAKICFVYNSYYYPKQKPVEKKIKDEMTEEANDEVMSEEKTIEN